MVEPMTEQEAQALLDANPGAVKQWNFVMVAGQFVQSSIRLLLTGSSGAVRESEIAAEMLERRGRTYRLRRWCERGEEARTLARLAEQAKVADVTLQLLCVHEPDESTREHHDLGSGASVSIASHRETYPVVWLNSKGEKWGKDHADRIVEP